MTLLSRRKVLCKSNQSPCPKSCTAASHGHSLVARSAGQQFSERPCQIACCGQCDRANVMGINKVVTLICLSVRSFSAYHAGFFCEFEGPSNPDNRRVSQWL